MKRIFLSLCEAELFRGVTASYWVSSHLKCTQHWEPLRPDWPPTEQTVSHTLGRDNSLLEVARPPRDITK